MGKLRAIAPIEKQARKRRMLRAAEELLEHWNYTDITMDRIAERAGVAKGTLYLYFRTKETLFLQLYEHHLEGWYSELSELADLGTHTVGSAEAARVIASTLSARPTLIRLQGLMHSSLSRNIDLHTTTEFMRRRARSMSPLASALAVRVAGLSTNDARRFLVRLELVAGALAWAAYGTKRLAASPRDPDLAVFDVDFEEELTGIVTALLR